MAGKTNLYTMSNANWMGNLLQQHPAFGETKINHVFMPGTHDSGTFTVGEDRATDHTARTQSLDIKEQLQLGVRYFDLRLKTRNDTYYISHGPWMSDNDLGTKDDDPDTASKKYLLKQMHDFLKAHPKEILILKFQNFTDFGTDDYLNLVNLLKRYFTFSGCGLVSTPHGSMQDVSALMVNQLLTDQRRVFLFFDKKDVPNDRKIWDFVFQYSPVLAKGTLALWDPYWHDKAENLADDNIALTDRWWPFHESNLRTWNSKGLFVLQSHMQQLPGKESDKYFNIAEQVAAETYYLDKDVHGHPIHNNKRNIQHYISLFQAGQKMNIVTFDFIQHGDVCNAIVQANIAWYQKQEAAVTA